MTRPNAELSDLSPEHQRQAARQIFRKGVIPQLDKTVHHKYAATRTEASGHVFPELAGRSFPSKLERDRACELVMLQRDGQIDGLDFQVQLWLTDADIGYKPDFAYRQDGRIVFEETKGFDTDRWRIIKKLWRYYGPGLLRILKRGAHGRIVVAQEIMGEP